jgi:3-deoxy-D-manno-octulosonate 8-phosphate phosphatase (KDO 8-P phosphatase)
MSDDGTESKTFQSKDGLLIRMLPKLGFTTIFLTGRRSKLIDTRAEDLHISVVIQGVHDKKAALGKYLKEHGLNAERVAYVGDDLNDHAAMLLCGMRACPADAAKEVRKICDYVSTERGGYGAVRDFCEYLLRKQGQYDDMLRLFGITAE